MSNARARILWTLFALIFVVSGTLIATRFAKGYRPSRNNLVNGNGLLVVNSTPKGARVLVNDRFLTATDDTLYLDPAEYQVEIQKDGYFPWKKTLRVEKELVTQANALLFPAAPSLTPLTFAGALAPMPSPDGQRIAFYVASSSAQNKNGYYIQDLTENPLALQRGSRQVTIDSTLFPPATTLTVWSPNSAQLLLVSPTKAVLLDPNRLNDVQTLPDISFQLSQIFSQWEEEMYLRDRERLAKFPPLIQEIATTSAVNVYFDPEEEKILYTATTAFTLPNEILPTKPASSTQQQARTTEVGRIYVYDRNEDRQFLIGVDKQYVESANLAAQSGGALDSTTLAPQPAATPPATPRPKRPTGQNKTETNTPVFNPQKVLLSDDLANPRPQRWEASPSAFRRLQRDDVRETVLNFRTYHSPLFSHAYQWFPNSYHLIQHDQEGVNIMEYDATNAVRVYSGPFDPAFVYPWPNGSRLLIRTNFNQADTVPANLYTIDLR